MGLFRSTLSVLKRGLTKTRELVTAGFRTLTGRTLDESVLAEIERLLLIADVGVSATTSIMNELRAAHKAGDLRKGEDAVDFIKARLKLRWIDGNRTLAFAAAKPTVILVAGVNGAGKTTSVAKIAKSLRDENRTVLLAAADTFRAGAVAQLSIWAQRLGVEIVKGKEGADPASVVFDAAHAALARSVDVLLIDTAGRLHTQDHLMRQLTKIRDVVARIIPGAPHEVLLVLDATSGQNAIAQARLFKSAINVTGIFLATLDGSAKGGVVIAIRDALDVPVKLVGIGETPDDVAPFDPDAFIDAMFSD